MRLNSKVILCRAPKLGTAAYDFRHYTRPAGLDMIRFRFLDICDDIPDYLESSFSSDNGCTWSESLPYYTSQKTSEGIRRLMEDATFVDPVNGRLLNTYLEGYFWKDIAAEGWNSYRLKYRVSDDGGRTSLLDEPIVGNEFSPEHPFDCIWVGKKPMMNGAQNSIVRTPQGHLVFVAAITVLGSDGKLYNPGGGYGWFETIVLHGHWQADWRIEWELKARIALTPDRSTRGLLEPTIAQMADGRLLIVMRGSNGWGGDPECKLPSHKWYSISADAGFTWSAPQPWRFTDGTAFYSPSGLSVLMWHSNGKLYWFGNVSKQNCQGNYRSEEHTSELQSPYV